MPPWMQKLLQSVANNSLDSLRGSLYALGRLAQGDPNYYANTMAHAKRLSDERKQRERDKVFGTGEVGGDNKWEPPVHATTANGIDLTVSFGRKGTDREGQVLYKDGHTSTMNEFYGLTGRRPDGSKGVKKHEHDYGDGGGSDRGQAPQVRGE